MPSIPSRDDDGHAKLSVIKLCNVTKSFPHPAHEVRALRGVSLDIEGPGFFAIMGPSGSGKSTLLHLIAGLDRPDSGSISVAGNQIHEFSERQLTRYRRSQIGIVFQQFNLISTLSAQQNVELPGLLDGMPTAERRRRSTQLLEALGLIARAEHRPDALSGGEQQRVAIARSLLFEPQVLLADEPTGNLDSVSSEMMFDLLNRIAIERSMTVLLVTHEPTAAVHCQHVYVMRDGVIADSLSTDDLDPSKLASRVQFAQR
jgi:putative ABC transport system ATP-binding protein